MGFGSARKAATPSRRSGPSSVPLLFTFTAANLADTKKSNGDKDTFTVVHVRGGLGKNAGDTDTIRLGKYEKPEGAKDRPSLWDHLNGKNRVDAAKPGTVYLAQECTRGSDGVIEARWLKNLAPSLEDPEAKVMLMPGIMAKVVTPSANDDGTYRGGPQIHLIDAARAVRVGGHSLKDGEEVLSPEDMVNAEKMKSVAGKPLSASLDDAIKDALAAPFAGEAGFLLRIIPDDNQEKPFSVSFTCPREKRGEEYVTATPEEGLEAFKKAPHGLYDVVLTEKDGFAEIIPYVVIRAGKMTAERAIDEIMKRKEKDGIRFPKDRTSERWYGEVEIMQDDGSTKVQNRSCYMDSVIGIRTMDPTAERPYYFWTDAYAMDRRKFAEAEVITDNLSDDLAVKYTAFATERGKHKQKAENANQPAENTTEDPALETAGAPAPGR